VPTSAAADWHCKYKISASSLATATLDSALADRDSTNGYIYLEAV
jgi:hypothetical protein